MRPRLLLPILLGFVACTAYGLTSPPGSTWVGSLLSSQATSIGSEGALTSFAASPIVNPAIAAALSLPGLELSYTGLVDPNGKSPYAGTGITLGGALPTPYGVYSASGRFLTASPGLSLGTFGDVNFSFAKALYPSLLIGAGLGLELGTGSYFDWGLGLNLGFVSLPGTIGVLKDFRWGATFSGIGKPYRPFTGYGGFPSAFTPAVDAGFQAYRGHDLSIQLNGGVSFPSFEDVRVGIGGDFSLGKSTTLRLSSSLDLRDVLSQNQPFPLSGGISLTFAPRASSAKLSRIQPSVAVEPIEPGVYALGGGVSATIGSVNRQPPRVAMTVPRVTYISPNGTGGKDTLVVPVTITDQSAIVGYELTVRDSHGRVVRTITSPSLAISATGSAAILDRLLYAKGGVPIPHSLVWNGRNANGKTVPDGTYTYVLSAWNEYGKETSSAPAEVIVSTKPPVIHLAQPAGSPPVFSPNGDGYKDTLTINQTGSREPLWVGRFFDSTGAVVRTIDWRNSAPKSFVWNGRGNGGKVLPDGVYHYQISATNRAGNRASAAIPTIVINTSRPVIGLAVSSDAISPGTSSPQQMVQYRFRVPQKNDVVSWEFAITSAAGTTVRSVEGGPAMPDSFAFDGTNQQGSSLPDGVYHARLSVIYRNGSHSSARAAAVTIDREPPTATVSENYHVFSPIGSGARNTVVFTISASTQREWKGIIANGAGAPVETFVWQGHPPAKVSWNGRGVTGTIEPDGVYQFYVDSTDEAGNYGQSNVVSVSLDTQHKRLFLSTNYSAFSPNGSRDTIRIAPQVRNPKGFKSYRIDITNRTGTVVGSFAGTGVPTGSFAWNGLGPGGQPVAAGEYRAVMTALYATGATVTTQTPWFSVITKLPALDVSVNYHIFSPNADGHRDTVTFRQSAQGGKTWVGRIASQGGKTILTKRWSGSLPGTFVWNGTDTLGNIAPNGTYSYMVSARDPAGNVAQAQVTGIVLDNRPTQVYIDTGSSGFSPNGDGVKDTMEISTVEKPSTGIASWQVSILDAAKRVVREWSGSSGAPPRSLVWNGSTTAGTVAPDGSYRAKLVVHYTKGDVDTSTTSPFLLVAGPPVVAIHLSPLPFTPQVPSSSGGSASRLTIHLSVASLDPIAKWKLQIYTPPIEEPFYAFSGTGAPPPVLSWNGKSAAGESMIPNSVYSYHLSVTDQLGNSTLLTGNIPIGGSSSGEPGPSAGS